MSKARTYAKHKTEYKYETYLDLVKIRRHRVALTKLRLPDHILMIEVGRHRRPKLDIEQRLCKDCHDNIEDEAHFLVTCLTHNYHKQLIDKIVENNPAYSNMTEQNQYTYIMNINNPMILNSTAYTIHKLFKDKVSNNN